MPRTNTLRLFGFLWVAWIENDWGIRGKFKYGFTQHMATMRAIKGER